MTNIVRSDDKNAVGNPVSEDAYAAMLLRVIEAAESDPHLLRDHIYALARNQLKREAVLGAPRVSFKEAMRQREALERAIARVEALASEGDANTDVSGQKANDSPQVTYLSPAAGQERDTSVVPAGLVRPVSDSPIMMAINGDRLLVAIPARRTVALVLLAIVVVLAAASSALVLLDRMLLRGDPQLVAESHVAKSKGDRLPVGAAPVPDAPAARGERPGMPLPRTYGVYAVADNRLHELHSLPVRVPDERVAFGPILSVPSQTLLPNGKLAFVVYRRDLVAGTPERVPVRVITRIARALSFESGKAVTRAIEGSWAVRGKSFELRVSPLGEDQQMILLKPASDDFSFPPGRYALLLRNQAYDFAIEGVLTDPAQCVESVQTVSGTIYSACRGF